MPRAKRVAAEAANEDMATTDYIADAKEVPETHSTEEKVHYQVKHSPLNLNTYVTVRNGFNGKLVYKSRKTGEKFVWGEFGAEQDMELSELKNAKNASKAFFENNWFLFDNPEVIAFLGLERMYKNALEYDTFDDLFRLSPDEISARIALLSDGQKTTVCYRARQKIADEEIDSIKVINALEKSLGIDLVER